MSATAPLLRGLFARGTAKELFCALLGSDFPAVLRGFWARYCVGLEPPVLFLAVCLIRAMAQQTLHGNPVG